MKMMIELELAVVVTEMRRRENGQQTANLLRNLGPHLAPSPASS
jgi:hypothetical protein